MTSIDLVKAAQLSSKTVLLLVLTAPRIVTRSHLVGRLSVGRFSRNHCSRIQSVGGGLTVRERRWLQAPGDHINITTLG